MKTKVPLAPALAIDVRSLPAPDRFGTGETFTHDGETIEAVGNGVINWESKSGVPLAADAAYRFYRVQSSWSIVLLTVRFAPRSLFYYGPWGSLSVFSPVAVENGGTLCEAIIRYGDNGGPRFQCGCGSRVYRLFLNDERNTFLCRQCVGNVGPVVVAG